MRARNAHPDSTIRRIAFIALAFGATGCFATGALELSGASTTSEPALLGVSTPSEPSCSTCSDTPILDANVSRAIERRIADLKGRGGACSTMASVLEQSYRSGQIVMRPYMWRVGSYLASGEAKPNGDMIIAREIDSLNVGARTLEDLIKSMEHEAAHIAFKVDNDLTTDRAEAYVRACSPPMAASSQRAVHQQ